jgi:hypothetical protein
MTLSAINARAHLSADARPTTVVTATERTRINSVIFLLAFTCLTERIGLTLGNKLLAACLIIVPAAIALLTVLDFFRIDRRTILIFSGYLFSVMLSTALNTGHSYVKPTALIVNISLSLLFCVCAPLGQQAQRLFYKRLCALFIFFAALSCIQFFGQFALPGPRLFSLEGIVPDALRIDQHFAFASPTAYASSTFRSNGFVFLEPANAGTFYARGVAIIATVNPSIVGVLISSAGLLVTYAGTGFVSLLIFLAGFAWASLIRPRVHVLLFLFAIIGGLTIYVIAPTFYQAIGLERLIGRLDEFGPTGSSAYGRYVGPSELLWAKLDKGSLMNVLFGLGIGSSDAFRIEGPVPYVPSSFLVIAYESGLVGLCLYVWLIASAFTRTFSSIPLRLMFLAQFVLIDAGSNIPSTVFKAYLIAAAVARSPGRTGSPARSSGLTY